MVVTVFGLGFVGLTTALGFAHFGDTVYGVDVDEERKARLRAGDLPFCEPDMGAVLKKELGKHFFVTDDAAKAVVESEFIFYCVGTPYGKDGGADLSYLFAAIDTTIAAIHDDKRRVLVTKSTIPPTTTCEKILPYVQGKGAVSERLSVADNPEFLREGHCWEDFIHADRIVLGCTDKESEKMLRDLYAPMNLPVFCVSATTAEFIKYLSNTLLATLISYANEMAQVADAFGGIDVAKAFRILHLDGRWNGGKMASYFYPGCGYGGYCLPKDTNALYAQARTKGYAPAILREVIRTNDERPLVMAKKIVAQLGGGASHRHIGAFLQTRFRRRARYACRKDHSGIVGFGQTSNYRLRPLGGKRVSAALPRFACHHGKICGSGLPKGRRGCNSDGVE